MVLNVHRNQKDLLGMGEGGMTGGRGRGKLYTYRYAVTTRMTPALRWAAKGTNSQDSVYKPQPF